MNSANIHHTRSLYIDLELSCWLGPPPAGFANNIIQIGLVEVDLVKLEIRRQHKYYVRPKQYEISPYCTKLTGIRAEDIVKLGHPISEVMATIQKNFGPMNKMCFAWGNDNSAIIGECAAAGIPNPFGKTIIDLGTLFRGTFLMKNRMKLKHALEYLEIPFEGRAHDALVDAKNTAMLHLEMIRRLRGTKIGPEC